MPDSLPAVEARWSSPYVVDQWARMLTMRTNVEVVGADLDDAIVLGPTLPSGAEPRVADVVAFRDRSKNEIQWVFRLGNPPDEPPPENIKEADARVGGREGLARLMLDTIGSDEIVCEYTVTSILNASEWSCAVLPRKADVSGSDSAIRAFDSSARVERIGYRFPSRDTGLLEVEITYLHKAEVFQLGLLGIGQLLLSDERWLPHAENLLREASNALFVQRAVRHEST